MFDYINQLCTPPALQIRAGQRSITASLWPLTAHAYHVMIIVISSFSKSLSLLILFLFPINFLNNLELVFLEFKHLQNVRKKYVFFLSCSFFTCCFMIILWINALHLFIFSGACKHTGRVCSLFYCCFAITLCAFHLLCLSRFIKTNPSSM